MDKSISCKTFFFSMIQMFGLSDDEKVHISKINVWSLGCTEK